LKKTFYKNAIVRLPCPNMVNGLTTANLGKPDYQKALRQHYHYSEALEFCGLKVHYLPADNDHPDSTFVEDIALLTPECALITNPAVPSRKGETRELDTYLKKFYRIIEFIREPGTMEAGDILKVGSHYYIGLSKRTNQEGAKQLIKILEKYGMTGSTIHLEKVLHLKTGVAYLENNQLVATGEFITKPEFGKFHIIGIDNSESYAANCVWINGKVILPAGFPITKQLIEDNGYATIAVDLSEFRKLDGGVSCLSLRF
jgi:dimethylargininase